MEWSFIIKVLKVRGFSEHFQQLIHSYMNSVSFSLLLNGNVSENFQPNRGLSQGDPVSPLLFILGSEILTRLLGNEELESSMHGIKVDRNAPPPSSFPFVICR